MEIKVRALDEESNKSVQEVEKELLEKHEEENAPTEPTAVKEVETQVEEQPPQEEKSVEPEVETPQEIAPTSELNEEDVLSYIKKRYKKEVKSVDELFAQKKENEELPADVSAYFKYKKETGRGIEDYVKLNKDYGSLSDDQLLSEYYAQTEVGLDPEDIRDLIEDRFSYDENIDDSKFVKKTQRAKKRELAKAKNYLNELKEKYKTPLVESTGLQLSEEEKQNLETYKSYVSQAEANLKKQQDRTNMFLKKTDEVFNSEFKGFDFKIEDKTLNYSPGETNELKKAQSNILNFINKYTDKEGVLSDASGYHKALAVAMNPEKFARYFYDQGKADAIENDARRSKNIDMDVRSAPQSFNKDGLKVTAINQSSGRGLKIKSIKKV